jgi:hypothetical protein
VLNRKMQEQDLFDPIKGWLEEKGYEVYAEVEMPFGRADVVGKNHPAYCVVEMKTSLNLEVISQAIRWRGLFHYIYIAIPRRKRRVPSFANKILHDNRIGLLEVDGDYVRTAVPARYNRPYYPYSKKVNNYLYEEQKTWVKGGSNGGGYVTPYKITMSRIKEYLKRERYWYNGIKKEDGGWRTINEILEYCETHYQNPKSSLAKALQDFENDWCESKKENGKLFFRHK